MSHTWNMSTDYLRTSYSVPAMDCAAEEQMVRIALGAVPEVVEVGVDLRTREVQVTHTPPTEQVTQALVSLGFGARELGHEVVAAPATPIAVVSDVGANGRPAANAANAADAANGQQSSQRRVLMVVLIINATMFAGELLAGLWAQSTGLIADSLDMLADAVVYAMVLAAVGGSLTRQRRAAQASGWLMLGLALLVLVDVVRRVIMGSEPVSLVMILVGVLALVANVTSLVLLSGHREGGAHLRASWIFTTRDALANAGVIVAGILVLATGSAVPDLIAGVVIAGLVGTGAVRILRLR